MSTWQRRVGLAAGILLALCVGGCTLDLEDIRPARSIPVQTSEFEGVILLRGDWVPTSEEVLALEEQLVPYLAQERGAFDSLQAPIEERLPTYRRQYWGVLQDGRRLIVANFFCDARHTEWTEREVAVIDGGDCYFRLRYDVETGAFSHLLVNGVA